MLRISQVPPSSVAGGLESHYWEVRLIMLYVCNFLFSIPLHVAKAMAGAPLLSRQQRRFFLHIFLTSHPRPTLLHVTMAPCRRSETSRSPDPARNDAIRPIP